jgi:DNA-binding transcriptional MerR regulator
MRTTSFEVHTGVNRNHVGRGGRMRIGELAEATGVSTRSLRYYEELDLIRSTRTGGGWREFDDTMVERVVTIQHLFAAGLGGVTIGQLLPCLEAAPDQRTGELEDRLAGEIQRLQAKRRDIDRELDLLHALRDDTAVVLRRS